MGNTFEAEASLPVLIDYRLLESSMMPYNKSQNDNPSDQRILNWLSETSIHSPDQADKTYKSFNYFYQHPDDDFCLNFLKSLDPDDDIPVNPICNDEDNVVRSTSDSYSPQLNTDDVKSGESSSVTSLKSLKIYPELEISSEMIVNMKQTYGLFDEGSDLDLLFKKYDDENSQLFDINFEDEEEELEDLEQIHELSLDDSSSKIRIDCINPNDPVETQ
ncbi:hypothetical protein BY996DRAFT_6745955 [Phakopsora pachyrhizi]|uniref:Expressed protein n=1 Tax=Phakopsora pachyrhizi TaxID=170000 RepID=A0AAV0ATE8_PHAPC|nr:hypothetical protein BY996DRAFT_6745955 [Phakopsora pachyrhizi]CAH7671244.1 expressed protein [Phakopsora pachyrhizi]